MSGCAYNNEYFALGEKMLEQLQYPYEPDSTDPWQKTTDWWLLKRGELQLQGDVTPIKEYFLILKIFHRLIEFQEQEPQDPNEVERVRLKDLGVNLDELKLGERTLFPCHLPRHYLIL